MKLVLAMLLSVFGHAAFATPASTLETDVKTTSRPRWEIRTAPVAFYAAWTTVDAGFRIGSHFATGPAYVSYNMKLGNMFFPSYDGQALGWYANYYSNLAAQLGTYASLHLYKEDYISRGHPMGEDEGSHRVGYRADLAAGYRRSWSFFDLLLGGGLEVRTHSVDETKRDDASSSTTLTYLTTHKDESLFLPFVEIKAGVQF